MIEATNGDRIRHGALIVSLAALSTLLSCSSAPQAKASPAPRSPIEDIKYANEWPSPGEVVAIDMATGQQMWATKLSQIPLGGATVANDLVFTTTLTGDVVALSRKDGSIAWTSHLPAGSNATLAISGGTLLAGAGLPLNTTQHAVVVDYQLGAS